MSESKWPQMRKLNSLHPELRPKVERVIGRMYLHGFAPMIYFGYRGLNTQEKLLSSGNSGVRVSFHNHVVDGKLASLAVDIVDAKQLWGNHEFFVALGEEYEAVGLIWGGRWSNPDMAHGQLWINSRLYEVTP